MKIAHISDIHIRFSLRHEEYKHVFDRLYKDLKKIKPDRIIITGDLNHYKINMSPGSLDLAAEFLYKLSCIAPIDTILGNHDLNLQQLEQGDTISPILKLFNLVESTKKTKSAYIVNEENKNIIDFSQKSIYFFEYTGLYEIGKDLVYGVFSCKDGDLAVLKPEEKNPNKKYIALYHGQIYGARADNGVELKGDDVFKLSVFDSYDAAFLGDLHEYQTFRNDEIAYAGSLLQQDYGESIDKGYLLWNLEKDSIKHERRFIPNDFGFAKITLTRGENFEERLKQIKFSNDKKKTKVSVIWEDYEENYSLERETQIINFVKNNYGCQVVKVDFEGILKNVKDITTNNGEEKESFIQLFEKYIKEGDFDVDEELLKEIVLFAADVEKTLGIKEEDFVASTWELDYVEICNLFTFGEKPFKIDMNKHKGVLGIFGQNYCGKSNFLKAIVWGLYNEIIGGNVSDVKKLVNVFTDSNKGYVYIYLTIDTEKFRILRTVTSTKTNDGDIKNSYSIKYEKFIIDENGEEKWSPEVSDKKATEKKEAEKIIKEAIGTFEDFTKVSLQVQNGKDDYLSLKQQPKNDLINRYLGLESYRDRHEYINKKFNEVKKNQKNIGNLQQLETQIVSINNKIIELEKELAEATKIHNSESYNKENADKKILELTSQLLKVERLETNDKKEVETKIFNSSNTKLNYQNELNTLNIWLNQNFKQTLPFSEKENVQSLEKQLEKERQTFLKEKEQYLQLNDWVSKTTKIAVIDVTKNKMDLENLKINLVNLKNQLPLYRGQKCPTCGSVTQQENPDMENKCIQDIENINLEIQQQQKIITESENAKQHNSTFDSKKELLDSVKISVQARKDRIEAFKNKITLINSSQTIINHNLEVENKTQRVTFLNNNISSLDNEIFRFNDLLFKIDANQMAIKANTSIQNSIDDWKDKSKVFQLNVYNINKKITEISGDIKVEKNNLSNINYLISELKKEERLYKKYSIYLQAVHRDGIPMLIIRKKLPMASNIINRILSDLVGYKLQFIIKPNGDILDEVYFMEDKSDALPTSFASGAQRFTLAVAIQDGLNYISKITKSSIKMIDEGFGTLDNNLTHEIYNTINYLKNKYKNVLIVTHKNEIKDFVEKSIEFNKTKVGISSKFEGKLPEDAGISVVTFN